ncbi:MAG: hypothetical protein COT17_02000 [Elusimicrobia bacterium CG08_land_8_20_14_0_20_51_18]|nr:MAG: hypothetical protein COT17_02000 [Elusimicrobia bacterium CG08_land_8_20_14_0_20_51_18]
MKKTLIILLVCCLGGYAAEKKFYASGPSSKKEFALTYDDGPGLITEDLLALLKKYGAPANFFILGENAGKYPEKLKKIAVEGHLLGGHTYSHKNFYALDKKPGKEKILEEEMLKTASEFRKAGLPPPVFIRLPNGFSKKWALDLVAGMGCKTVNWSYGSDWEKISEEKMTENYLKALRPGAIILMHDAGGTNKAKNLKITEALLIEAGKRGLKPVRLDELLGLKRDVTRDSKPGTRDPDPKTRNP